MKMNRWSSNWWTIDLSQSIAIIRRPGTHLLFVSLWDYHSIRLNGFWSFSWWMEKMSFIDYLRCIHGCYNRLVLHSIADYLLNLHHDLPKMESLTFIVLVISYRTLSKKTSCRNVDLQTFLSTIRSKSEPPPASNFYLSILQYLLVRLWRG